MVFHLSQSGAPAPSLLKEKKKNQISTIARMGDGGGADQRV